MAKMFSESFFVSTSAIGLISSFGYGDDEISHRLRAMGEAQRHDPPDDSARSIRRREKGAVVRKPQVKSRARW